MKPVIIWMMLIVLVSCGEQKAWDADFTVAQRAYYEGLPLDQKAYFESCHTGPGRFGYGYCMRVAKEEFGEKPVRPDCPERPGPKQVANGPGIVDIAVGTAVGGVAAKAASKLLFD